MEDIFGKSSNISLTGGHTGPPLQRPGNSLNRDVGEHWCGVKENRLTAHSKNGLRSILPMGKNFMLPQKNCRDDVFGIQSKKRFFSGTIKLNPYESLGGIYVHDDTKDLTDSKSPIESIYNNQYFNLVDYIVFFQHTSELSSQPNRLMQYITEFLFESFSLDGVACFFSSTLIHSVQKPHLDEKYAKLLRTPMCLMKEENIRKGIFPHQEVLIHTIQNKIEPKIFFLIIQRNINQDHGYYELMKNFLESISTIAENAFLARKEQTMLQDLVSVQLECLNSRIEGGKLHSHNVQRLALDIASAMGMKQKDRDALEIGGLLFDIGKIGISDEILNSPSHLSEKEYEIVKQHVEFGRSIIANFQTLTEDIRQIVYDHHELIDGSGYPKGLKGDQIPLKAKIICVCDVYCAMTEKRAYREAWSREEAQKWIETNAGVLYDPNVVQHLIRVVENNHG